MSESDEDGPPPLAGIPQQVEALASKSYAKNKAPPKRLEVQSTRNEFGQLKKGFLCKTNCKKKSKEDIDDIPILRSNGSSKEKQVPDFLRVPGVEEYTKFKNDLVAKLNPTKETLENIQKDPFLAQAFSDPEIMAAMGDVASDPKAFAKYKNNRKVVKFYEAFGMILGQQLQADQSSPRIG